MCARRSSNRTFPRCSHSPLTACPGPASPATFGDGEGTRLRRVLLRWQAPQPCHSCPGRLWPGRLTPTSFPMSTPTSFPTRRVGVPLASVLERICPGSPPEGGQSAAKTAADWPPSGGVERPGRKVRFARLIHRPGRVLGGPVVRAACGGNLSLILWPRRVVPRRHRAGTCGMVERPH